MEHTHSPFKNGVFTSHLTEKKPQKTPHQNPSPSSAIPQKVESCFFFFCPKYHSCLRILGNLSLKYILLLKSASVSVLFFAFPTSFFSCSVMDHFTFLSPVPLPLSSSVSNSRIFFPELLKFSPSSSLKLTVRLTN